MATTKTANKNTKKNVTISETPKCDQGTLNPNVCIITRDPPASCTTTSRHVGISQEIYDQLYILSTETGRNMRWLCNRLLDYALKNVQFVD